MGWCSGTDVFDAHVETVLQYVEEYDDRVNMIEHMIKKLEDNDWDCQQDSGYYERPEVNAAMRRVHPEWFEAETQAEKDLVHAKAMLKQASEILVTAFSTYAGGAPLGTANLIIRIEDFLDGKRD